MDHHTVAAISIAGTCLDVLGSLYLAYDLLDGQHGPLRLLARPLRTRLSSVSVTGLALGRIVFRHTRIRFRSRTVQDFGFRIRNRFLPFLSQSAKYSPILTACVLPSIMPRLVVRGLRVVYCRLHGYGPCL